MFTLFPITINLINSKHLEAKAMSILRDCGLEYGYGMYNFSSCVIVIVILNDAVCILMVCTDLSWYRVLWFVSNDGEATTLTASMPPETTAILNSRMFSIRKITYFEKKIVGNYRLINKQWLYGLMYILVLFADLVDRPLFRIK